MTIISHFVKNQNDNYISLCHKSELHVQLRYISLFYCSVIFLVCSLGIDIVKFLSVHWYISGEMRLGYQYIGMSGQIRLAYQYISRSGEMRLAYQCISISDEMRLVNQKNFMSGEKRLACQYIIV